MQQLITTAQEFQDFDGDLRDYYVYGFFPLKNGEYWPFVYENLKKIKRNPRPKDIPNDFWTLIPAGAPPYTKEVEAYYNHIVWNQIENFLRFLDLGGFLFVTDDYHISDDFFVHTFFIDATTVAKKVLDTHSSEKSIHVSISAIENRLSIGLKTFVNIVTCDGDDLFGEVKQVACEEFYILTSGADSPTVVTFFEIERLRLFSDIET